MLLIKKIVKTCCEVSAKIGMAAIFILLALTVSDVFGRFIFNKPIPGTFELTKILFALSVFFSLPVSQYRGENLGITILYDRFPLRIRGILDLFASVLSITTFSIAFFQTMKFAARMQGSNTTTSVLRWPMFPWIYIASIGIIILVIALLGDFAVSIKKIKGDEVDES
jgi:TRAP-type C4-dicarboxylate transport system permease small subunit